MRSRLVTEGLEHTAAGSFYGLVQYNSTDRGTLEPLCLTEDRMESNPLNFMENNMGRCWFISGWILMADRPVRINDFIEIDTWRGTVERIGNCSTRIRLRIADLFEAHGVVVAFPQRDVHLDASAPLKVQIHDDGQNRRLNEST